MKHLLRTALCWVLMALLPAQAASPLLIAAHRRNAVPLVTSYNNPEGSGDRTNVVTVTASAGLVGRDSGTPTPEEWVNGLSDNASWFNTVSLGSSVWLKFDFTVPRIINEMTYTQQQLNVSQGFWKWQGSNNNISWTDLGSSFEMLAASTVGGNATYVDTSLGGNHTAWRYYRLLGVSGSTSTSPYVYEFNFKIDPGPTSYSNPGGSGDRSSIISVSASPGLVGGFGAGGIGDPRYFIDGANATAGGTAIWLHGITLENNTYLRFDFGAGLSRVIQEATYTQSNSTAEGIWQWQGSNDGSTWTNIGGSFALGGSTTNVITTLAGNGTGYRYYQMIGVSGTTSDNPWAFEMNFKIN